jgi:hypothetical protein
VLPPPRISSLHVLPLRFNPSIPIFVLVRRGLGFLVISGSTRSYTDRCCGNWEACLRENCHSPSSPLWLCLCTARPHRSHRDKRPEELSRPSLGSPPPQAIARSGFLGRCSGRTSHWQALEAPSNVQASALFPLLIQAN